MRLIPEKVPFRISTTDLEVIYTESGGAVIRLDVQTLDDTIHNHYREIQLKFSTVAELRCITLNLFEQYAGIIDISLPKGEGIPYWEQYGYPLDSGLYQVIPSTILEEKEKLFDPHSRLNLRHYLIAGYDSYIEIIASGYTQT